METYIVTYLENYPGALEVSEEERTKVAFVLAKSFQEAADKVSKMLKKECESVTIKAISVDEKAIIIV